MRKPKILCFLSVLLVVLLVLTLVHPAFAASTVGTSTENTATNYPFQRKSFYAAGRFWVFYSDGTNMVYCTSTDGSTWSAATTVKTASNGNKFSIWFDGTYLHYAYADISSIYYRRGTPNSDGSITWSADEQTISTTALYPMVSVDSNGYVWIGYLYNTGTYYYPYVIKSGNNDGTWGTGTITQLSTTSTNKWRVSVVPLTSGKMLAVYASNGATVKAKKWDGSAWGTEVATTSAVYYGYYHSAVAQGDDVHLVFLKNSGYDILYVKYTYSSNSFGTETTLQAGATDTSIPVLSIDTSTNDLYVFAATKTTNTPSGWTADHIYYKKYTASSGTWGSWIDWIDESSTGTNELLYYADRLTCFYKAYGNYIGLEYMTKTASPYNVKFAYLTVGAAGQSYTVDLTETVTTAWNILTKWNAIVDFSQTITSTWNIVLSHGMFVDLLQSVSFVWNVLIQSTFNTIPSLSIATSLIIAIISTFSIGLSQVITTSWSILTQWNAIASLSQQLSTVWNVLIQWTSNVGLTQSLSTAWTILTQTSYNIIASLSNTFTWTVDVLKYVAHLYTVDLSLTIVTSWIVNTIHTWIDWSMVAIGLAMVAFIVAAAAIALR